MHSTRRQTAAPVRSRPSRKAQTAATATLLEQIPNIGRSIANDLRGIGVQVPDQLKRADPYELYDTICRVTGVRHDPCLLDTFISAVRFMNGAPPHPWWHYTAERKAELKRRG